MHKKVIKRDKRKLTSFSKRLDKEKDTKPKLYERNEKRLGKVDKAIMKL